MGGGAERGGGGRQFSLSASCSSPHAPHKSTSRLLAAAGWEAVSISGHLAQRMDDVGVW